MLNQNFIRIIVKIIIVCGIAVFAAGFLLWSYIGAPKKELSQVKREVLAQEMVSAAYDFTPMPSHTNWVFGDTSSLTCQRPIPIGEVLEDTIDIMDDVFQVYQMQANNLDMAVRDIQGVIAALSAGEDVCDFSKCQPQVSEDGQITNLGPNVALLFDSFIFEPIGLNIRIPPWCAPKECVGQPCPDISPYVKGKAGEEGFVGLDTLAQTFGAASRIIHNLFDKPLPEPIIKELRAPTDPPDPPTPLFLTRIEETLRKLELAKNETTPWSGMGPKTCVLNEEERALLKLGEIEPRKIELCAKMLEEQRYWPRPWSYHCEKKGKCQYGLDDDCKKCLKSKDSCDENSWIAQINCQLFMVCEKECENKDEFDEVCYNCFCGKFAAEDDPDMACLEWICGGSALNFVCCE